MKKPLVPSLLIIILLFLFTDSQGLAFIGEDIAPKNMLLVDERDEVFDFEGVFDDDDEEINVRIEGALAGDTIYAHAAGVGFVDTYLYLLDENMEQVFAEDNDSGGGFNAALSYELEEDGVYHIGLITIGSAGDFHLQVGINTPEVIGESDAPDLPSLPSTFDDFECGDAEFGDRPTLSGPERTHDGDDFIIHYTLSGHDSTSLVWVEAMAEALQLSIDMQVNILGWALPPADCGEGGDSRLDVYVLDIADMGALGIARPENVVGDNPNTDGLEYYAAYSYLIIENDIEFATREEALHLMRTTAAHEVHHNIQFGYDVNDRFFAFYEAGASWIETVVYPNQTNAGADVDAVFDEPDRCIGSFKGRSVGDYRIYGEWLMIDSFVRDLGSTSYQFVWEAMIAGEGLSGFYAALEELGTTPQEVIERMAIRNLLYDYTLAKHFDETVLIEATISRSGFVRPRHTGIQELGVDYIRIAEMDVYSFELVDGDGLMMFVVGIDQRTDEAFVYDIGTLGTVDLREFSNAYVIVLNGNEHRNSENCDYTDWIIQVFDGDGETLTAADNEIWDASEFVVAD